MHLLNEELPNSALPDSIPLGGICAHCGNGIAKFRNSRFCCAGCETVYGMLQSQGLGRYYELRARFGDQWPLLPPADSVHSFAYLDDPAFVESYAGPGGKVMRFYLEGVHCAACVWLTEKLPTLAEGVQSAELNLTSGVATVAIHPGGSFARAAEALERLGYRPHPFELRDANLSEERAMRRQLLRMGVAAAGSGNIMLLAIALYTGADEGYAALFRWVSLALYIPVFIYSAEPFFRNAVSSLRVKRLSIDVPIAFGLSTGTIASIWNLMQGSNEVYFDSLSGLIFLLLASRYLLSRVQARAADASHLLHFLTPSRAQRRELDGLFHEVRSDSLQVGDEIEVLPGSVIPADGVILTGWSEISRSWMTGEAKSELMGPGGAVLAGSLNESASLTVRVTASGAATRLGDILRQTEKALSARSSTLVITDQMARFFVPITFAFIAAGFWVGYEVSVAEGIARAMAVAIVACPCALALAIPLAMSLSIGRLAKGGVLVRGADVLEKLSAVDTVFFDKTGTLTDGQFTVTRWVPKRDGLEGILLGLEAKSQHPIARAIRTYFSRENIFASDFRELREVMGVGVGGVLGGRRYAIRRSETLEEGTEVALYEEGEVVATLTLSDRVRPYAAEAVRQLGQMGISVGILSGDNASAVAAMSAQLHVRPENSFSGLTPEAKAELVKDFPGDVLMVGDGANDSIALASASVGMAIQGGLEVSMRAAGIYGASTDPLDVVRMIKVARETMRVIRRNLVFTVLYNVGVIAIALSGLLQPLVAAVLMPLSAFTVFCLSIMGTRRLKKTLREMSR